MNSQVGGVFARRMNTKKRLEAQLKSGKKQVRVQLHQNKRRKTIKDLTALTETDITRIEKEIKLLDGKLTS